LKPRLTSQGSCEKFSAADSNLVGRDCRFGRKRLGLVTAAGPVDPFFRFPGLGPVFRLRLVQFVAVRRGLGLRVGAVRYKLFPSFYQIFGRRNYLVVAARFPVGN
jgi:hypothetical protein